MKLLIVDDEKIALTSVKRLLKRRGIMNVDICDNGKEAIEKIKQNEYDIALLDLLMPEMDGLQVLQSTKSYCPRTEFIMLTAVDDVATAVKAIRLGAYDYLVKPVENERLVLTIEHAFERKGLMAGLAGCRSKDAKTPEAFSDMITKCPRMREILSYADTMARSDIPILITGDTGTGKELLARGIHKAGETRNGPFVAVNVSAIPPTLFESQFFGHVKGAYTGADYEQKGFFEKADGGTLFLDEIGELPVNLQSKLLRALEDRSVIRVGDTKAIPFTVRVLAATNQDLETACQEGRFRLDLYYRINSAHVHLPPLKERDGDVPLLAAYFLKRACRQHLKNITDFSPETLDMLMKETYPGNVRELSQMIEKAVILSDTDVILPHHLKDNVFPAPIFNRRLCTLQEDADIHIAFVLDQTRGDRKQAAEILGVSTRQVQRRLAQMRNNPMWADII